MINEQVVRHRTVHERRQQCYSEPPSPHCNEGEGGLELLTTRRLQFSFVTKINHLYYSLA